VGDSSKNRSEAPERFSLRDGGLPSGPSPKKTIEETERFRQKSSTLLNRKGIIPQKIQTNLIRIKSRGQLPRVGSRQSGVIDPLK